MTPGLWPAQLWPALLAEAWAALSADSDAAGDVRLPAGLEVLWVSGAPGNLPSRLPAEDVAIACAGAALLAAAALHAQRGGDSGSRGSPVVRLDRGHVAAAFRSEAFLRVDGAPSGPGFAPLSRFWRAADGWVRTHGNYPWHRAALLRALGCAGDAEGDTEPVAAAIAELGARQVEDLVTGAGGVAAAVRDEAGWRAEPPGQAVAATALVEATSAGDALPRWRPAGPLPASGIRVLDLTRVIAGPVATRYLGALGADVLRLDPPDRPELTMQTYDGLLAKRSALLDFGTADGHDRLHELLSGADVLVHGYRPHALDRPGMLDDAIALREFMPGDRLEVGPFGVRSWLLPHWMPNAGLRLEASGQVLAYTGDSGPSPLLAELAHGAGLFLAEATYPWQVEGGSAQYLSSARQAGAVAREAGAGRLVLTHLWPGTDPDEAVRAAAASYPGEIAVASPGLVTDPARRRECQ